MEKKESTIGKVAEMQRLQTERESSLMKSIYEKKTALAELKEGRLDTALLDSLIDDVKALCHVPVEVFVPLMDVLKEYDFGSFHISRCKNCFVWKTVNFRSVVEPSYNYDMSNGGGALYASLTELCELADKMADMTATDDEKMSYEISLMLTGPAFSLPVLMFSDPIFAVNVFKCIMDEMKKMIERKSENLREESQEDIAKNQAFEAIMREDAEARAQAEEEAGKKQD